MDNVKKIALCFSLLSAFQIQPVLAEETIELHGRSYFVFGDMLIPVDQLNTAPQTFSSSISPSAAVDSNVKAWTRNQVIYQFESSLTAKQRQQFLDAAALWSKVAEVSFVEHTDQDNYILVSAGNKNYATVGMVGKQQAFVISDWYQPMVIAHEIGHTLGLWHEQQRQDRDNYVTIKTENIQDDQRYNFTIRQTTTYSDYDFLSVMHYGRKAWSKNGEDTIVAKPGFEKFQEVMGQHRRLSAGDQLGISLRYGTKNIEIPDPAFKAYLVEHFDLTQDGEINTVEAAKVSEIHTPGNGQIQSLEGLEYFQGVTLLDVSNEALTQLPELPLALETLDVSGNQIAAVDASWFLAPLLTAVDARHNPIDVYSCEAMDFAQSIGTTGSRAISLDVSPNAAGSEVVCNEFTRNQLISDKPRFDLRSKGDQVWHIEVPENAAQLIIDTQDNASGVGGSMDLYVARERVASANDYEYLSTNPGNQEHLVIDQPQAGEWYITLSPNDRSFENVDLVASVRYATGNNLQPLSDGQSLTGLSSNQGEWQHFYIDVTESSKRLIVSTTGTDGDADLYVRFAAQPTATDWDCRPYLNGSTENCEIPNPQPGRYFVSLKAYQEFHGLSLVAKTENDSDNGGAVNQFTQQNLSATTGQWLDFPIELPAGVSQFEVTLSGGQGDADLYIRQSNLPALSAYDCRSWQQGNEEVCKIQLPASGQWYISLHAYRSFEQVNLKASW